MEWILVNRESGGGRSAAVADTVQRAFRAAGVEVVEKAASTIPEIQDIATQAARANIDRIWVLGGDGTMASTASGLCYSKTVLCPLPGGTANVLCREFGIPLDATQAVHVLLAGQDRVMDVGQVNEIKFLLMASVGLDSQTVRDVNLGLKRWVGSFAYIAASVGKLLTNPVSRMTVVDEHGIERVGYHVVIQNTRFYGGSLAMAPAAKLDDGRFDVILVKKSSRPSLVKFAFSISSGRHLRLPYVEYFRTNSLQIRSSDVMSLQADGDCLTRLPAQISILPKALTIRAPKNSL